MGAGPSPQAGAENDSAAESARKRVVIRMCWLREVRQTDGPPLLVVVLAVCLATWGVMCGGTAWALGTPASTVISNTASVTYTMGSADPVTVTAATSFEVLEIIDSVVTWQDVTDVAVNTPQANAVLTFLLTNTGNGPEVFQLSTADNLGGDDFNPQVQSLWFETNGLVGLQTTGPSPDTLYQTGLNDPDLSADSSQVIYLLSDIPSEVIDGQRGQVQLQMRAATPGAADADPGTELTGQGLNGVNAVVGATRALSTAFGWYTVATVDVNLTKSIAAIVDPQGGDQPYPGARVTYRLRVEISGTGLAQTLVISDLIPADMTYATGSITVDGLAQSDAIDPPADMSDYNITAPETVTVNLGDVNAPAVHVIEFETTIN
jgi:uncharacterized repeat protein (TIGR01451 family)